jgi:hypothetical protein
LVVVDEGGNVGGRGKGLDLVGGNEGIGFVDGRVTSPIILSTINDDEDLSFGWILWKDVVCPLFY